MKKILLIIALSIIVPNISFAEDTALPKCESGIEIPGKNTHYYCMSSFGMNWWSAFNWCQSQNRRLVTIKDACDRESIGSKCENLNAAVSGLIAVWTSIASGTEKAYAVQLQNGSVAANGRSANNIRAFCY